MKPAATATTTVTAATVDVRAANECIWADPLEYRGFPTPSTIDLTPAGRRHLADALIQSGTVGQALVLLGQASVALYSHPDDKALRFAALAAVDKARGHLLNDGLSRVQARAPDYGFDGQATALDLAEFSIHHPRLYREQRMWRLKAHWLAGHGAAQDKVQVMEQERAQLRAQAARH